jgi:hypothetical protein
MLSLINQYTYLFFSIVLIILLCFGLLIFKTKHWKYIILSGLLSIPTSLSSIVFVPDYWDPDRIINLAVGPEDFLFSFATGCIMWFLIMKLLPKNFSLDLKKRRVINRYLKVLISGCLLFLVLLLCKINIMGSALLAALLIGCWILFQNRSYVKISFLGFLSFFIFYLLFIKSFFLIFPAFLEQWNHDYLLGIFVWGIPVEELAWAAATGAVWPLIIAFLFDLRVKRSLTADIQ